METAFIYTSQFFKIFISPENHFFLCFLLLVPWIKGKKKIWRILGRLSLAWIVILFCPLGTIGLYYFERLSPPPPVDILKGKWALVLSGGTGVYFRPLSQMVWFPNSARVQEPLRMYRKGIFAHLLFTGGQIFPMSSDYLEEATSVGQWWQEMGVPAQAMSFEEKARNTWENFTLSMPMLPAHEDVVLVTSAFHLPRALMVATKLGLRSRMIPYPVDYKVRSAQSWGWWSYENLANFQRLFLEIVGMMAYKIVGFGA